MKCEKDKGEITDYINGQMTADKRKDFELHLADCPFCQEELNTQQEVWNMLGNLKVPETSTELDYGFKKMLNEESGSLQIETPSIKIFWRVAAAVVLVAAGFAAGYITNKPASSYAYNRQVDSLSSQVHEMRELMMLSLLENPSASERIKAVSYTSEINQVNTKMINALLTTLNNDPNVNVRLMTLEALMHYADNRAVREGLVQSIVQQESPLVQSAMADAMIKMQEKKSIQPFKKLLEQKQLNNQVRTKIEQTISRLI
jgi:hypothetical protein